MSAQLIADFPIEKEFSTERLCDEDLVVRIAGGDKDSFKILAARYMNLLYEVANRMSANKADAEDITQESLLRIWSKANTWQSGSGASVSTWIYRIAYNLCIDKKRRTRKKTVELLGSEPERNAIPADKAMHNKQVGKIVAQVVAALPERQRAALVLCHYEGLSNAEAAAVMETSVKGIEGLLVRARKTLHKKLAAHRGVLSS